MMTGQGPAEAKYVEWSSVAFYTVMTGANLFCAIAGIHGMGYWGTVKGWGLLALWAFVTASAISIKLMLYRRKRRATANHKD